MIYVSVVRGGEVVFEVMVEGEGVRMFEEIRGGSAKRVWAGDDRVGSRRSLGEV